MDERRMIYTAEQIDPDWMTRAMSARFPGVCVTGAVPTKRIGGTATKIRYELQYDQTMDGLPASVWVKGDFDSQGAHQGEAFINEARFFRDIRPELDLEIPDCFFGEADDQAQSGIIVLEDLGVRGARFGTPGEALSPETVSEVLKLQAHFHAPYFNLTSLDRFGWLKPGGAMSETNMVDQYFGLWPAATAYPRFELLPAALRSPDRPKQALNKVVEALVRHPQCLIHGDSHCGNIYFLPGDRPGYLDWQHTMQGRWAFDAANLIVTAMSVPDRRLHERTLIEQYVEQLKDLGVDRVGHDEAWEDYRRFIMWSFMWIMCPPEVHPESICSANAERVVAAMSDLGTLEAWGV